MSGQRAEPVAKALKESEKLKKIDFKMISFTLAGKDYGIDILKVKEIRKSGNFTKVPNTPVFVRGVDNLRGDIIPVIDLRVMFNLPAETKDQATLENIIILRLESLVLGIVVDSIEKVIGIDSETIQPPHPIFGDINIKYINGVVENNNRLYIILDVDRIFGHSEEPARMTEAPAPAETAKVEAEVIEVPALGAPPLALDLQFVTENLVTFGNFYVTPVNREWVAQRLEDWKSQRAAKNLDFQFNHKDDALEFLAPFYSPFTGQLWSTDFVSALTQLIQLEGSNLIVWNPGCGKGYESYSLALWMETQFKGTSFKVWANDHDLLNISTAPSLIIDDDELDLAWKEFTVQTKNGLQFNSDLKSRILFEFHDINNMNPFTVLNLTVIRDVLSFLLPNDQEKLISEITEKSKSGAYLVVGSHERIDHEEWKPIGRGDWSVYQKI